ncbi:hypothetical protein SRHO_G00092310 [Serrasalmus rhombeus]
MSFRCEGFSLRAEARATKLSSIILHPAGLWRVCEDVEVACRKEVNYSTRGESQQLMVRHRLPDILQLLECAKRESAVSSVQACLSKQLHLIHSIPESTFVVCWCSLP